MNETKIIKNAIKSIEINPSGYNQVIGTPTKPTDKPAVFGIKFELSRSPIGFW